MIYTPENKDGTRFHCFSFPKKVSSGFMFVFGGVLDWSEERVFFQIFSGSKQRRFFKCCFPFDILKTFGGAKPSVKPVKKEMC